jgi:hypothetical protein
MRTAGSVRHTRVHTTVITVAADGQVTDDTMTNAERLVKARCILGAPKDWQRLRRWAHPLGSTHHGGVTSRQPSSPN